MLLQILNRLSLLLASILLAVTLSAANSQEFDFPNWDLEQILDAHESSLVQVHSFDCSFLETSSSGFTTKSSWSRRNGVEKLERKAEFTAADTKKRKLTCYEVYFVDFENELEKRIFLPDFNDLPKLSPGSYAPIPHRKSV